ncbi:FKBP-type peptidyl-prolyl cis-trans isomerase [Rapidithrix thailandica]|uniref:Peptidyl-prolyl cis-trans isomerase n=1 Tax=Rapidithrix thailandica TaxID=413964 RepID=A0AAW9RVV8_9BACT
MKLSNLQIVLGILFLSLSLSSCSLFDNENPYDEQMKKDRKIIDQYITDNDISATRTNSGLYYYNLNKGYGTKPASGSIMEIKGELYKLDGTLLDDSLHRVFLADYGTLTYGITEGSLLLNEGGSVNLIIPSGLAFGENSGKYNDVSVEKNTILRAQIALQDVRDKEGQKYYETAKIENYLQVNEYMEYEVLDSGVYKVVLEEGTGEAIGEDIFRLKANYKGTFLDGEEFDKGQNADFRMQEVITGWKIALSSMKKGERALILVPSHVAYGFKGNGEILPYSTLVFEIELLETY